MKRILLALVLPLALAAGNSVTAQSVIATDGPELSLSSETIELGVMTKDSFYNHVLSFTNTGNAPLIISNAKGSCGCTVPTWPRKPIGPGETESIKIRFRAGNAGPVNKLVYIYSNANNGAMLQVPVRGRVNAPMAAGTNPVEKKPMVPRVNEENNRR